MASYELWFAEQDKPTPEDRRHERENKPENIVGFWRIEGARTKPDYPVAIWKQNDRILFKIGLGERDGQSLFSDADAQRVHEFQIGSWLKCVAVSEDTYHAAMKSGRWPDEKPARQFSDDEKLGIDIIPPAADSEGRGTNSPDGEQIDQFHEQVTSKIQAELDKAEKLPFPIKTMQDAEAAAAIIEKLRGLGQKGEAQRKAEKQKWLDGAAAIDTKWSLVKVASDKIKALVSIVDTFKRAEQQRLDRERQAAEAAERERLRKEEEARLAAEVAARAAETPEGEELPDLPTAEDIARQAQENADALFAEQPKAEAPKVQVRTAHGRAVSKAKVKRGVITDKDGFIAAIKDQASFDEFLQTTADKLARAGTALNGMRIETE
jgi:hypothetical protein